MRIKRSRMPYPRPLADVLQQGLGSLLSGRLREADIWRLWPEVVGAAIAKRAQPQRIINGVLTVVVSSGPWMQELTFLKGMMKEKLNSHLGAEIVKEIVLKSGKVVLPEAEPDEPPPPKRTLSASEQTLIARQAAAIVDEETRAAFMALMQASLERDTSR